MLYIFLLFIVQFAALCVVVGGLCYGLFRLFTVNGKTSERKSNRPVYSVGFDTIKEKYYIKEGNKRIGNWLGFTKYYDNKAKALFYVAKLNGEE